MKKVLIWLSGGNKKNVFVRLVRFLNSKRTKGAAIFGENEIWLMGGINTQRRKFARFLILCHVMARKRQFFFRECSSTINWHNGVNDTVWCQVFPLITYIYGMKRNHAPVDNVAYITLCMQCIDTVNKLHRIFEFGNNIIFPNKIDTSRLYEFGLDYVHESMNDSTRCLQKTNMNPIKCIQCIYYMVQCLKRHCRCWYRTV